MSTFRVLTVAPPGTEPAWPATLAAELAVPHLAIARLIRSEAALRDALMNDDFIDEKLIADLAGRAAVGCPEGFVMSGLPIGPVLATVAREHDVTHVVATLGGLPGNAFRELDTLRRMMPVCDLASDLTDASVVREAGRFLRQS
jgi:hypothetical protein